MIEQYSKFFLEKDIIATIPATKLGKYNVLFIYGGIDYAYPKWMINQVTDKILAVNIGFFIPNGVSMKLVNSITNDFLKKNYLNNSTGIKSLIGFSEGGVDVFKNYSKDYKFIGLINPITKSTYQKIPFTKNTYMIYFENNWSSYPNTQKSLPKVANLINSKGGYAQQVALKQTDMPKYFFKYFESEIK